MTPPVDAVSEVSTTFSSCRSGPADLRLLHFNDVYHIEPGSAEPVGGIARFQTVVNEYRNATSPATGPELLTFFSGDAYNPSLESTVTKGRHMVNFLNGAGTNVACVGNHDLDFGIAQFRHLRNHCSFPWLLANVLDPELGEGVPLADCEKTVMLTSSNGIKVGVIGLAEREWLDTVNFLPAGLIYKSATETAEELIPGLREQGAEIIIAVTHQREPNDLKLAEKTTPGLIDLVLCGHDHFYAHHVVNKTHVLRSGTDFKQLSYVQVWRKENGEPGWDFTITRREIVRSVKEDAATLKQMSYVSSSLRAKLERPVGYTSTALDARFSTVRSRESNIANFMCDLMRYHYNTDVAFMAGGTIRGDQIYPPGIIKMQDILNCFPFEDPVMVIRVSGNAIWEALENGVSLVPALEGRFPQVSNIQFEFDPSLPPGSRICWAKIGTEPLARDSAKLYTLATRGYLCRGKDGFSMLKIRSEGGDAEEVVSEENGVLISTVVRQYFLNLKVMGRWRHWSASLNRHYSDVQKRFEKGGRGPKSPNPNPTPTPLLSPVITSTSATSSSTNPPLLSPYLHTTHHRDQTPQALRSPSSAARSNPPGGGNYFTLTSPASPSPCPSPTLSASSTSDSENDSDLESALSQSLILSRTNSFYTTYSPLTDAEAHTARLVARKWMRLAGVKDEMVQTVDEAAEEFLPGWTRGVAPRVEGRILRRGG